MRMTDCSSWSIFFLLDITHWADWQFDILLHFCNISSYDVVMHNATSDRQDLTSAQYQYISHRSDVTGSQNKTR